jgi:DNA polymerase III subunit gamma/tau
MTDQTVLYQKYRPRKLNEVVGQDHVKITLTNAVEKNRLRHAYLFTGSRGTGKTTLARIVSLILNCENGPSINYDVDSEMCKSIIAGKCPDVTEMDAASNSSIDDVREIRDLAQRNPMVAKKRVLIIDEVHCLRKDTSSVLLKILEEPPKNTVFVLATTDPQKILKTIQSRCQRFDLRDLTVNQITDNLKNICDKEGFKGKIEDGALQIIARVAEGSVRDSLSILDAVLSRVSDKITVKEVEDIVGTTSTKFYFELMDLLLKDKKIESLVHVKKAQRAGNQPKDILLGLLQYLHDIMLSKQINKNNFLYIEKDIESKWLEQRDKNDIGLFLFFYRKLEEYLTNIENKPKTDLLADIFVMDIMFSLKNNKKNI